MNIVSISVPDMPHNIKSIAKSTGNLQIAWDEPKKFSNCIQEYRIRLFLDDLKTENAFNITTNKTSHTFNNLYACTSYNIWVNVIGVKNIETNATAIAKSISTIPEGLF